MGIYHEEKNVTPPQSLIMEKVGKPKKAGMMLETALPTNCKLW